MWSDGEVVGANETERVACGGAAQGRRGSMGGRSLRFGGLCSTQTQPPAALAGKAVVGGGRRAAEGGR